MSSPSVCLVGMHFARPGAPKVYNRNAAIWSEYEVARSEKYGCKYSSISSGLIDVKYIDEKPVSERLKGLSSLHISKVRRII